VVNHTAGFAMIDALHAREYLEVILDTEQQSGPLSSRPVIF